MIKNEKDLLVEMEKITSQAGYINTLTKLYLINNYVKVDKSKDETLENIYAGHEASSEYLMRNELAILYNSMCQSPIKLESELQVDYENQYQKSLQLCEEIHEELSKEYFKKDGDKSSEWREAFFYSAENIHTCQLINFFEKKYFKDNDWLIKNKGFSVQDVLKIIQAINGLLRLRLLNEQNFLKNFNISSLIYNFFIFEIEKIKFHTGLSKRKCLNFFEAFTNKTKINNYCKIDDFNDCKAYPFLKISNEKYYLPSFHLLLEALHDTPYYWMIEDENYCGEFSNNKGAFAEDICEEKLSEVFDEKNVYKNVQIYKGKALLGEIDTLVVCGEIALIIEIKSKRMTLKAKQGDIEVIEKDFKLSIQKAYDQLSKCSSAIINKDIKMKYRNEFLNFTNKFKKIFTIFLISEPYPSLNFQVKDLLTYSEPETKVKTYVIDIFFLDVLCEYLNSPLKFLNFLNRRMKYYEIINSSGEYSVLGFHLEKNLYFNNENALYFLEESSLNLGVDFIQRREYSNYKQTKFELLDLHNEGYLGHIVNTKNIEINLICFNFFESLFIVNKKSWKDINQAIAEIFSKFDQDGLFHSAAIFIPSEKIGYTFCIDQTGSFTTYSTLRKIVQSRKYISKAEKWFGVVLKRDKPYFSGLIIEETPWVLDSDLEYVKKTIPIKIGRNELCYCGSTKKYKKCCF